jgi:ABC-type transporter Mla MlaB component
MESQLPFFSGRGRDFDGDQMLRITRKANGEVVFKVSGQLNVENLDEMEKLIKAERKGSRIDLDLTDLISVDGEAVEFLVKCETDSIKLKNCSAYIREWIRRERLRTDSDNSSER